MNYEQFQEVWAIRGGVFYSGVVLNYVEGTVLTVKLQCGAEKDFYEDELYDDFDDAVAYYARLTI